TCQFAGEIKPAGKGKLIADLVEADGPFQFAHHALGLVHRRDVKPDDQPVVHGFFCHHGRVELRRAASSSVRHRCSMDCCMRLSENSPFSSKARSPSGTEHSGETTSIRQRTSTARRWAIARMPP